MAKKYNDRQSKKVMLIERKLSNDVNKLFKKLELNIINILNKELKFTNKQNRILQEVEIEIEDNNEKIVERINVQTRRGMQLGNKYINTTLETGIGFDLIDFEVEKYFDKLNKLYLSDKLGSIRKTTKDRILNQIKKDFKENKKLGEIIKNLQNNFGISRERAKLIGIAEIGKGYEYGKEQTMKKFQGENKDKRVVKFWITVGDNRVTPTHRENAAQGIIGFNKVFGGTGDKAAPGSDNPRCRCSTGYDIEQK